MSVLYIKEQGATVRKKDRRITVSKESRDYSEIPVENLENVAVIGNVQVTTQALHLLLEHGVDVSYFTRYGKFLGQASAEHSKNIFLRFAQYDLYQNLERRNGLAKKIVANKIDNQIELIRRQRTWRDSYDWKKDADEMRRISGKIAEKQSSNELMGIEGICSNIYFRAFGHMFSGDFEFNGRNRRPPKDPINVLISLGYTFLTREVSAALEAESFEMYLGLLHGIRYGRKSLALDIVEEFRQPVVDGMVLRLCNKRIMNRFDFEMDTGISINEDGFKKFCREFEHTVNGSRGINYRGIFRRQAQLLKTAIMEGADYLPYSMREREIVSDKL